MNNSAALSTFEKVVSLCKRRGFFYHSCDIYGGINGLYDYGPLACELEKNITQAWQNHMKQSGFSILNFNGALLSSEPVWKASGHVENFHDPLIDCKTCKARYRTDDIDIEKSCIKCGNKNWSDSRQFNMMFSTTFGPVSESGSIAYLRPETAQSIFIQFKNILNTNRVKIPFGIMQVGKSFRNEITPRQFLFRLREFTQMEMEFFCTPENTLSHFDFWVNYRLKFYSFLGIKQENLHIRKHDEKELSHYSKDTVDIEYKFSFGWKEIEGIANRTNYDLIQHSKHSRKDLSVYDDEKKESYFPHVIECSVGLDRLILLTLCDAYYEEKIEDEIRIVLKLKPLLAPIKIAIFPLTKNEEEFAKKLYTELIKNINSCFYDDSGSIGKRYRRQDEIGTPFCITIDENSLIKNTVTIRDRDTMKQEIVSVDQIEKYILKKMS